MGNTGAYMLRWRNWKYIAFGHTFDTFSVGNGYAACSYAACSYTVGDGFAVQTDDDGLGLGVSLLRR